MVQICPQRSAPAVQRCPSARRQRGAVAVIMSFSLVLILALVGMALDLSRAYNRQAELHGLARATALAAAKQLNGTAAGVDAALAVAAQTAANFRVSYNTSSVSWSDSALRFSAEPPPSFVWMDAGGARAAPGKVYYVKVDTSALGGDIGVVNTILMQALPGKNASVSLSQRAVAGRSSIDATPLGLCAMAPEPAAPRKNPGTDDELVEFGFRRGVNYDLMQLNGAGTAPMNFAIDPISPPGTPGKNAHTELWVLGRFLCAGSMWLPNLTGAQITVKQPFRLDVAYKHLNSRFNQYYKSDQYHCEPEGAPPDMNVKSFAYSTALPWMPVKPTRQSAQSLTGANKLWTVADAPSVPPGITAPAFGPLWIHGKAVPYSAWSPDTPEPAKGYTSFPLTAWPSLYHPGTLASGYPGGLAGNSPYMATLGVNFEAPSGPAKVHATRYRRILNLPLLACPVTGTTATVLGVGRFLMTVPATPTSINAEFVGAIPASSLGGNVELF